MAVINVNNGSFSYDGKTPIFKNLSFVFHSGEIICLLGANGIGKTTLLKGIMNIVRLSSGTVTLNGTEIKKIKPNLLAREISYIPQSYKMTFPYPVIDLVMMGRTPHLNNLNRPSNTDYEKVMDAIKLLGLSELVYRPCNKLSGGQLQMVMIARAVAQEAKFVLLDEPTSHLDYGRQMETLNLILNLKKHGIGVLMTTHTPDHAFLVADKVAIMDGGGFAAVGTPDEIVTKKNLQRIYRIPIHIAEIGGDINRKVCVPIKICN